MTTATQEMVEGEIIEPSTALDIRHPAAPATLEQIAALGDGANEILRARIQVVNTLRKASIAMTMPEDWLLFHAVDGRTGQERTTAYLQDAGCDRVAPLWGIEIFDVGPAERLMANDGTANFMYMIRGSGRCRVSGMTVEQVEGGRSSSDDFCKDKTGTALELNVRKAARANLDGNIVRELTGLKSVPLSELQAAWEGSNKNWQNCVKARGYGRTADADKTGSNPVSSTPVPNCPDCGGQMWDNRRKKQSPNSPDFKCKDTKCGKAIWEKNDKPKAQATSPAAGSGPASGSAEEAGEIKKKRARIRGQFSDLGWDDKRQEKFLGGKDLASFKLDELNELIEGLTDILNSEDRN